MPSRTIAGHRKQRIAGSLRVPGDKSIAHRVLVLGSLARGTTFIRNVPESDDVNSTMRCLKQLGVACERAGDAVSVEGLGKGRYRVPTEPLDCGGSASTMRFLLGAVAGRGGRTTFIGDQSLQRRPMARVLEPLSRMGVLFEANGPEGLAPVTITPPDKLGPIEYELPISSAQVKTALIMAGLCASSGRTVLTGRLNSRDHTERFVPRMGGALVATPDKIVVEPSQLTAVATTLPGDTSSAAFFAAAATLLSNSALTISGVSVNPTRMGFFEALNWMGGDVVIAETQETDREPVGTIHVKAAALHGIEIHRDAVPFLVDEIPLVMLLACTAQGDTVIWGTEELRLKESDRIGCAVEGLSRMGASISVYDDHIRVAGGRRLVGARVDPWGDHRMSMMFTIAGLYASGESTIDNVECESKSCPHFFDRLEELLR